MAQEKKKESKKKSNKILLAFVASIIGCFIGYFCVRYLSQNGLSIITKGTNSIIIIGPCCGFASLIFMRVRNSFFGIWCFLISLFFTLYTEAFLFHSDKSLNSFFSEFKSLDIKVLISIFVGPFIAFYFGRGPKEK